MKRLLRLSSPLQERQRLETILSLCAEYNHEDSAAELAEVMRSGLQGGSTGTCSNTGGGMSLTRVDMPQTDEEAQREECSSTESTHQEVINVADTQAWWCRIGSRNFMVLHV